jgi:RNA recognition motif-containing protein
VNKKIYVGNLPSGYESTELENIFRGFGNVISAKVFDHSGPDWHGKYGFVEMSSEAEAKIAIMSLSNFSLLGRRITVAHILPR